MIEPDMSLGLNGKAAAVLSAVPFLRNDSVVIADDDVRYSLDCLEQVAQRLRAADIVRPQNYFAPLVWHARWDTARSLLNRSLASDYPGTLGIRRARLEQGYGGDVLFENLELIRTVLARGGEEDRADDIFVERRPPTARAFWAQRVRQAYDSFAQPGRLVAELAIVPAVLLLCRRPAALGVAGAAAIAVAERGRRRNGGGAVFAPTAALWAPVWLAERGLCSWAAVVVRLRGGPAYHGQRLKKAANSRRALHAAVIKEEQIERTVSDNNAVPERAAAGAR
ncbi:glycosyltransferase family 2 protein [Homoserinimonas hongtaonis]|uniref:glycosyltransferase family 2 protein n=1 Tax=Homoserinimonas hongtaonis TaxID=2079791 RepID=UPI0018EEC686|nr:glycosyltransferase family 2 protein [Salinibacterium hongtaonis]